MLKKQYTPDELSNEEYHASPGISSSVLKCAASETMEKVKWKYFTEHEPLEPTSAMVFGTAVHTAVLEPELFSKEYVDISHVDGRTKAGKEILAEIKENGQIGTKDYQKIQDVAAAVLNHIDAVKILNGSIREQSFYYGDEKVRADIVNPKLNVVADLKTCADASFEGFSKAILNYRYDIQASFYLECVQNFYPEVDRFFFICVESSEPHAVAVYELDEVALEIGKRDADKAYLDIKTAIETDEWPGYKTGTISLPQWYSLRRIEEGE